MVWGEGFSKSKARSNNIKQWFALLVLTLSIVTTLASFTAMTAVTSSAINNSVESVERFKPGNVTILARVLNCSSNCVLNIQAKTQTSINDSSLNENLFWVLQLSTNDSMFKTETSYNNGFLNQTLALPKGVVHAFIALKDRVKNQDIFSKQLVVTLGSEGLFNKQFMNNQSGCVVLDRSQYFLNEKAVISYPCFSNSEQGFGQDLVVIFKNNAETKRFVKKINLQGDEFQFSKPGTYCFKISHGKAVCVNVSDAWVSNELLKQKLQAFNVKVKSLLVKNIARENIAGNASNYSVMILFEDDLLKDITTKSDFTYLKVSKPEKQLFIKGKPVSRLFSVDSDVPLTIHVKAPKIKSLLYKCSDWDFQASVCKGSWKFLKVLTPSKDYDLELMPGDPAIGEVDWWNSSFKYRREVVIQENSGSNLTNYAVELHLNTSALIAEGKLQSSCADLRFVNASNQELNYWVESGCNTTNTTIWVNVSFLQASQNTSIWVYYGNDSVASKSNPDSVFQYFVNFTRDGVLTTGSSQDLTPNQWEIINDTALHLWGNNWKNTPMSVTINADGTQILEALMKGTNTVEIYAIGFTTSQGIGSSTTNYKFAGTQNWGITPDTPYTNYNQWQKIQAILDDTTLQGTWNYWVFGNDDDGGSDGGADGTGSTGNVTYKNVRIRSYTNPEPSIVSVNAELSLETFYGPVVVLNSPEDGFATQQSSISFNCSASDAWDVTNITLYTNISGVWQPYSTQEFPGSEDHNVTAVFTINSISEGSYVWNCKVFNNESYSNFAPANYSFKIDNGAPTITINNPVGTVKDTTPTINVSVNELASRIWYSIYSYNLGVWTANRTICNNCDSGFVFHDLEAEGDYTLKVWANDTAGNLNFTEENFTIFMNYSYVDFFNDNSSVKSLENLSWSVGSIARLVSKTLVLYDDFNDGSFDDDNPVTWHIVNQGVGDSTPSWQVQNGEITEQGNAYDDANNRNGTALGTYVYPGNHSWHNVNITVLIRSTDDDIIGVMFRYVNSSTYYRFRWNLQVGGGADAYRRLDKFVNGEMTVLANENVGYSQGQTYKLNILAVEDNIKVYIDGDLIFDVNDSDIHNGSIALYSWAEAGAYYDNVTVYELNYSTTGVYYSTRINTTQPITSLTPVWSTNNALQDEFKLYVTLNDGESWIELSNNSKINSSTPGFVITHSFQLKGLFNSERVAELYLTMINISWESEDIAPFVSLNSPEDGFTTNSSSVTFNCSYSDDSLVVNVSLYGNFTGTWQLVEVKNVNSQSGSVTFQVNDLSDGSYVWNCKAVDNSEKSSFASNNRSLTIDTRTLNVSEFLNPEIVLPEGIVNVYGNVSLSDGTVASNASLWLYINNELLNSSSIVSEQGHVFEWWNYSWRYRFKLFLNSSQALNDYPVVLNVNFSQKLAELGVNQVFDNKSVRVVEYSSNGSVLWQVPAEFEPSSSYNDNNAVGDVIFVANGSFTNRTFFIYFDTVNNSKQEDYVNIRLFKEDFESPVSLGSYIGGAGSQDSQPNAWERTDSDAYSGSYALRVYCNSWKRESISEIQLHENTTMTVAIKVTSEGEIEGIGLDDSVDNTYDSELEYSMAGCQWSQGSCGDWGEDIERYHESTLNVWRVITMPVGSDWYDTNGNSYGSVDGINYLNDDDNGYGGVIWFDIIEIWNVTVNKTSNAPSINVGAAEQYLRTNGSGDYNYFFTAPSSDGYYNVTVKAFAFNRYGFATKQLLVDGTGPVVTLNAPENNAVLNSSVVVFNFTASDAQSSATCNLTINGNVTDTVVVQTGIPYTITKTLENGVYYWNVTCWDGLNNTGVSETRNFTVTVTLKVQVSSNDDEYVIGQEAVITVNVTDLEGNPLTSNLSSDLIRGSTPAFWWNYSWTLRKAFTVQNPNSNSLEEYQVVLNLDTETLISQGKMRSDCGDIRVIDQSWNDGKNFTLLDYYVEGCNTENTSIWVKLDIPANSSKTIFVYYNNSAASSLSNLTAVFSYSKPRIVGYIVSGILANNDLQVLSLDDDNNITIGGTTLLLDLQESGTVPASSLSQGTAIYAKSLFQADSDAEGTDIISPASWAGTQFTYDMYRYDNYFAILSPWGNANVTIYDVNTQVWNGIVTSSGTVVHADIPDSHEVKITSDIPILVQHYSLSGSTYRDATPFYPSTTQWLYGVPSNYLLIGGNPSTSVEWNTSNGQNGGTNLNTNGIYSTGGQGNDGSAQARRVKAQQPIGAQQLADSDGTEMTIFLPITELGTRFGSQKGVEYIAIAAPYNETTCTVYDASGNVVATQSTTTNYPVNKICFNCGQDNNILVNSNWRLECNKPIYAYFEEQAKNDETMLLTWKQMRQYVWPEPTVTGKSEEQFVLQDVNVTNSSGIYLFSVNTSDLGFGSYVYITLANKSGYLGYNYTLFSVVDNGPPNITNVSVSPEVLGFGFEVNISAVITDESGVEQVVLNITYPDGSVFSTTMNQNGSRYWFVFNDTWLLGRHQVLIYARDMTGLSSTVVRSFDVDVDAKFTVATENDSYGPNEMVYLIGAEDFANWSMRNYTYRQRITVENPSSTDLEEYQVLVTIPSASLIQSEKMKPDCSDVRFTWLNESTGEEVLIPHYLEACNSSSFKMEVGSVVVNNSWQLVRLQHEYENPVVIAKPSGNANSNPVAVRLSNVTGTGFYVKLQAPPGSSVTSSEQVFYLVIEEGSWNFPDGTKIEAHTYETSTVKKANTCLDTGSFDTKYFSHYYSQAPVVLAQVQTFNNASFVTAIATNATGSNVLIALEVGEVCEDHPVEVIGWVAVESDVSGVLDGVKYETRLTSQHVEGWDDGCFFENFTSSFVKAPLVIAGKNSREGGDGGWVRRCGLTLKSVGFTIDEDQVADSERSHTDESVGFIAFEQGFATGSYAWVKVPEIPANSNATLFLYYGNKGAESASNLTAVFSYSKPRIVGYVVSDRLAGNDLQVLSLDDDNNITIGGTTLLLDLQEAGTIPASSMTQGTAIYAKSLFQADSDAQTTDITSPVSWAGTEFYYYSYRGSNIFTIVSPWGSANVKIYDDGSLAWSGTVTSSGVVVSQDITNNRAVRISSDIPILVQHYTSDDYDSTPYYPASSDYLYGVPSRYFQTGTGALAATVQYWVSFGSSNSFSLSSYGESSTYYSGTDDGVTEAHKVRGTQPIGVDQTADSDGVEMTVFLPLTELGTRFGSEKGVEYIAIAAPYNETTCTVYDAYGNVIATQSTTTNYEVNKICFNCGQDNNILVSSNWRLECNKPVYAYFEEASKDDETMLLSWKQMRQFNYPAPRIYYSYEEQSPRESVLRNLGSTSFKGYLVMKVQRFVNGVWQDVGIPVVDDFATHNLRLFQSGSELYLNDTWLQAGAWNTSLNPNGTYRVHAELLDINGNVLLISTNTDFEANDEFQILAPRLEITNLTHENLYEHSINEYEVTDNIAWINLTITNTNVTAINVSLHFNILDYNNLVVSWGPDEDRNCGTLNYGDSCTERFDNNSFGYTIPETATPGFYNFSWNVTFKAENLVQTSNYEHKFLIHNLKTNFSSSLNPTKIFANESALYNFTFYNPWSKNLTNVNITINCPNAEGMTCYCLGTNNNYCYLGQVASHSLNTVTFNITVNDSTPLGVYFLSVNVSYTNPGNEQKFWPEQEQQQLRVSEFGILEAVIHSNYSELDRGVLYNLTGFANNTNNQQALNVNLTWNLPEGWVNTSGSLTTSTPSLDPDNVLWNNITINITLAASLGEQSINLTANSSNIKGSYDLLLVEIFAKSFLENFSTSNTDPNQGDVITLNVSLKLDNGTALKDKTVTFKDLTQGVTIGSSTTDDNGFASINYNIPSDAVIGVHELQVTFSGDEANYVRPSNSTLNITVHQVTIIENVTASPEVIGFGFEVNITADIVDGDGLKSVTVNITKPNDEVVTANMTLLSGHTYIYVFNDTWLAGVYYYNITTIDNYNETHVTETKNFSVQVFANINASTEKHNYSQNQQVNLSGRPTPWWNQSWSFRKRLNITNNYDGVLESNFTVKVVLNTEELISTGKLLPNANDLRIVWYNTSSSEWVVIPRTILDLNTSNTSIWFKTVASIESNGFDDNYFVYYGNPSAQHYSNAGLIFTYYSRMYGSTVGTTRGGDLVIIPFYDNTSYTISGGITASGVLMDNDTYKNFALPTSDNVYVIKTDKPVAVWQGVLEGSNPNAWTHAMDKDNLGLGLKFRAWGFSAGGYNSIGALWLIAVENNTEYVIKDHETKQTITSGTLNQGSMFKFSGTQNNKAYDVEFSKPGIVIAGKADTPSSRDAQKWWVSMNGSRLGTKFYGISNHNDGVRFYNPNNFAVVVNITDLTTGSDTVTGLTVPASGSLFRSLSTDDHVLLVETSAPLLIDDKYLAGATRQNDAGDFVPEQDHGLFAGETFQVMATGNTQSQEKGCVWALFSNTQVWQNGNPLTTLSNPGDYYFFNPPLDDIVTITSDKPVLFLFFNTEGGTDYAWQVPEAQTSLGAKPTIQVLEEQTTNSRVFNTGVTSFKGFLTMKVQQNTSEGWMDVDTIVNNNLTVINSHQVFDLALKWLEAGAWNTELREEGLYRVFIELTDLNGDVLITSDGVALNQTAEFEIVPPTIDLDMQEIRIYDVTGSSNPKSDSSNLVGQGLNTTFLLKTNHSYRVEVKVLNSPGSADWLLNDTNVTHKHLNDSWLVQTSNIWYVVGESTYTNGFWNGTVKWDTSLGGVATANSVVTFKYVVNITPNTAGYYPVHFEVLGSYYKTEDHSMFRVVEFETKPPGLFNNTYNLSRFKVFRGENLTIYARWDEEIKQAIAEYNSTSQALENHSISLPSYNPQNWTNHTIITNTSWLLGVHAAKIYASDLNDNWNNSLPRLEFQVWGFVSVVNASLNPETIDIGGSTTMKCRVVDDANESVENYIVYFYNSTELLGTNTTNASGWALFSFTDSTPGVETITCNVTGNASRFYNASENNSKQLTLTTQEHVPPWYQEYGQSNVTIHTGDTILFYAHWFDNVMLDYAVLETNESGEMEQSSLASPLKLNGSEDWSNFSITIPGDYPHGSYSWRIVGNDTSGNQNQTPEGVFNVWGWAIISDSSLEPTSIFVGNTTTMRCKVLDLANNSGIVNYTVYFYNSTGLLGTNTTNASGWASFSFKDYSTGTETITCNITDNAVLMYNDSTPNSASQELNTLPEGADIYPPGAITYGLTKNSVDKTVNENLTIYAQWDEAINKSIARFNSTSTSLEDHNLTPPFTNNWTNYTIVTNSSWIVGVHAAKLIAWDMNNNKNDTLPLLYFNVTGKSSIDWNSPEGDVKPGITVFKCNVTEEDTGKPISNYPVYFYNESGASIGGNTTNSEGVASLAYNTSQLSGEHSFTCRIFSEPELYYYIGSKFTDSRTLFFDNQAPVITLLQPENNEFVYGLPVFFNFTAVDNRALNMTCNLYLDNDLLISNIEALNNTVTSVNSSSVTDGVHYWNVSCIDDAGNVGWSDTYNFTFVANDIYVSSQYIWINTSHPVENENVTISATVFAVGNTSYENVVVQFFRGDPDLGGPQIGENQTVNISQNSNVTVNVTAPLYLGPNEVYVIVDPPLATGGQYEESNENNNKANKTFNVESWHYAGGLTNDMFVISDSDYYLLFSWNVPNATGSNIFAADTDSDINWHKLQAIGLDVDNITVDDDFTQIDIALNSSNFNDSVEKTYTVAGSPRATKTFVVFNKTIIQVPVVNSTNNSNFVTGILWDYSDGGQDYNGSQDLVFITEINENKTGKYGTYDFEMRIPARLRSYKPSTDTVTFYTEIK